MSVAIATMGKYIPASGGTKIIYKRGKDTGTSDGWEAGTPSRRPLVVISSVQEDKETQREVQENIVIQVTSVSEE